MVVPHWHYAAYFAHPPKMGQVEPDLLLEEPHYHYTQNSGTVMQQHSAISVLTYWAGCRVNGTGTIAVMR